MHKESQNIEWKESWRDEYLKWICGFANAQGGKIFIGIDDKGTVTGVEDHKKLLEDIPNKTINHLGLVVDVNLYTKAKKHYLEISVAPSDVPIAYHSVYYYRSGSTKQELKGTALQQFILKKFGRSWDDMVVDNAVLKDIDSNAVKRFVQKSIEIQRLPSSANKENTETLLTRLHLLTDKKKLKAAALLLFGKGPLKYFTQAYFKIGRFGSSDADLKFQDIVEGNILDMADKVIELLRSKYLTSPIRYEGLRRIEELEYPEPALREAVLNAIVHKNYAGTTIQLSVYDDKLILWNPGTLPDEISIEQIKEKHASHPRNRNIAEIFFKAGYIESWGRGITKILETCNAAGLPEPDIKETQGGIQITLLKNSNQPGNQVSIQVGNQAGKSLAVLLEEMLTKSNFKPTEKAIAKYMSDEETMTENQIKILEYCRIPRKRKEILEEGLKISNQTKNFNANILPLLEKGLLQWTIKDRPQSPLQKYLITNKGKVILYIHEHKQRES